MSDLKKNEEHSHHHNHSVLPEEPELRVKAIETLLIQKGLIDPDTLNELIHMNTKLYLKKEQGL